MWACLTQFFLYRPSALLQLGFFFFFFCLFKKFLINLFNWRLLTLQYCGGFCHTLTSISHGCTCVPHPEPPSHLLPHPIPLGHPSAPALSILSHASTLDWRSISHMIIYMFQCYSFFSLFLTGSLVAQMAKRLPIVQETWVRSLGGEDPLEKEMATHFSILA